MKDAEKDQHVPEDETKKVLHKIQELTDKYILRINERFERKEKEILEI